MRRVAIVAFAALVATSAAQQQCNPFHSTSGPVCTSSQTCCGADTMSPSCIDNGSGNQCCVHYKSAKSCNSTQTCCGSWGPGASSYAFCCDQGSTCCRSNSADGLSTCCPSGSKCCVGASTAYCCGPDQECNDNAAMYSCKAPGAPSNTPSTAPAPTTAPGGAPASPTSAGAHHACLTYNGLYYDITSDAAITHLKRYNGDALVDVQDYAPFHTPAPGTTTWDEGVAFAATMQTRNNAWLNSESTSAATWSISADGQDTMTWSTTVNGAPVQFVFTTGNCRGAAPSGPAAAPSTPSSTSAPASPATTTPAAAPPSSGVHRACIVYGTSSAGSLYVELRSDSTITEMRRYNGQTLIDVNNYAPFHMPAPGTTTWDEGVAFAATMHTRNVWLTNEPASAATWSVSATGEDTWTWTASANGTPVQLVFRTSTCRN